MSTKSEFIISMPNETASEVVKQGKLKHMEFSAAYVYAVRSDAKKKKSDLSAIGEKLGENLAAIPAVRRGRPPRVDSATRVATVVCDTASSAFGHAESDATLLLRAMIVEAGIKRTMEIVESLRLG
ncbi:MAG: hypothetical protein EXQ69_04240 [Acidimicrobiia bacterium]|nr:hypothetical protein [Acidimicrobiia bacterium]